MVGNLSPEPPSNFDDQITPSDRDGHNFVVPDSDEESTIEDNGYQLLNQDELDRQETMEDEDDEMDQEEPENNNTNNEHSEEVLRETISLYNETRSSDIQIDEDQIRSVMSNINLPSSSIPAWARSIPDAQLSSLLHSQIERLQQR